MTSSRDHYIRLSSSELFQVVDLLRSRGGDERLYAWVRLQAEQKGVIGSFVKENEANRSNTEVG